jgi:hypothetical protein
MQKGFRRETATDVAALPHEFELAATQDVVRSCDVCGQASGDPRHVAWEQQNLLDRERARVEMFGRETGS